MGITINYAECTQTVRRIDVLTAMEQAGIGEFIMEDGREDNSALREDYQGRGYAEPGFAIVTEDYSGCLKFIAVLAENLMNESWEARGCAPEESAVQLAGSGRFDSMGLDKLMYFPGWRIED